MWHENLRTKTNHKELYSCKTCDIKKQGIQFITTNKLSGFKMYIYSLVKYVTLTVYLYTKA